MNSTVTAKDLHDILAKLDKEPEGDHPVYTYGDTYLEMYYSIFRRDQETGYTCDLSKPRPFLFMYPRDYVLDNTQHCAYTGDNYLTSSEAYTWNTDPSISYEPHARNAPKSTAAGLYTAAKLRHMRLRAWGHKIFLRDGPGRLSDFGPHPVAALSITILDSAANALAKLHGWESMSLCEEIIDLDEEILAKGRGLVVSLAGVMSGTFRVEMSILLNAMVRAYRLNVSALDNPIEAAEGIMFIHNDYPHLNKILRETMPSLTIVNIPWVEQELY